MPQDIPYEAGETPGFTPECLKDLPNPPTFTLRDCTEREKRWMRRLLQEEGVEQHSTEDLRAEMLRALKPLWGEEQYDKFAPMLEDYWSQSDEHRLQLNDNPELEWTFDPEKEEAIRQLELEVAKNWKPFAKMRADNADIQEISTLAMVAVALVSWSNLKVKPQLDRGYQTIDVAAKIRNELLMRDNDAGITRRLSWMQLVAECMNRVYLSEEEEKNSASPSPSETPPPNSNTDSPPGQSPASARSKKTRVVA